MANLNGQHSSLGLGINSADAHVEVEVYIDCVNQNRPAVKETREKETLDNYYFKLDIDFFFFFFGIGADTWRQNVQ